MNPERHYEIAKTNRQRNQESKKKREKSHPFKLAQHAPNEKHRARRRRLNERRAIKKRR